MSDKLQRNAFVKEDLLDKKSVQLFFKLDILQNLDMKNSLMISHFIKKLKFSSQNFNN